MSITYTYYVCLSPVQYSFPALPLGPERIKDLTYKIINSSTLRVAWNSAPDKYKVYYRDKLELPIKFWPAVDTFGNTALVIKLL